MNIEPINDMRKTKTTKIVKQQQLIKIKDGPYGVKTLKAT